VTYNNTKEKYICLTYIYSRKSFDFETSNTNTRILQELVKSKHNFVVPFTEKKWNEREILKGQLKAHCKFVSLTPGRFSGTHNKLIPHNNFY